MFCDDVARNDYSSDSAGGRHCSSLRVSRLPATLDRPLLQEDPRG